MRSLSTSRTRAWFLLGVFTLATIIPTESAWAVRNKGIVLRAAGSGAVIGAAAGLVSYPFAKSTGTIFAGAVVGALLGTAYGFYLVERRDEDYRQVEIPATELDRLVERNGERDAILARLGSGRSELTLFVPVWRF